MDDNVKLSQCGFYFGGVVSENLNYFGTLFNRIRKGMQLN